MKFNKKGKLSTSVLNSAILVIVILVVLLSVYSAVVPEAQTAGNSMNDSNRCASVGCSWNDTGLLEASQGVTCYNTSTYILPGAAQCPEQNTSIPLSGLFSGTGVIFVIVMAALLILVVKGFMSSK